MSFIIFIEATCFIIAFICLIKDANFAWRSIVLFLLITCATEISGKLLKNAHQHNQWLYNIFLVFEAGFTSLLFSNILSKYVNSRPIILAGLALLLLLYGYDIYDHGFFVFNDVTATVMSVVFVIYSFYYYFLLIKDEHYIDLKRSASFWWVAGTLFFYFGSTAVNVFFTYLKNVKIAGHNITYFIFTALTIILYGCWSYSFICKKWLTTTSQS
ncbi:hypothetical protein [Mucilaginibacter sp.]|uniref:hypothetical protein n=1 Tax=Mucilaginibacter sp. TaxID=1882438 RepID=UPI002627EA11|nr:hypothetical protein [Mucilaginibacter sp.]MDB5031567.1 hypothetical protein [Mucilaginibacter sp.]